MKPTRSMSPPGTYFVTFSTWQRRRLFVVDSYARLFLKILYGYRRQGRFQLHAFVLMPEHVHMLLTPADNVTLERAMQLIKGGAGIRMHSVSNLGARKFGREDLPTIGFATRRILRGIEITSTRIRSSADWSREQLNIVAALRFQATSWMCGPGRARLQSCPSRNLRECEFLFCGAAGRTLREGHDF